MLLVCLVPVFQKTTTAVKQSPTLVEVWCGGDDNLTQGVCRAVDHEFASIPTLIVTIPTNFDWEEREKRTRGFYTVEFTSTNDKKLGAKKGACWENDFRTCASQIVRHAKNAAHKLSVEHRGGDQGLQNMTIDNLELKAANIGLLLSELAAKRECQSVWKSRPRRICCRRKPYDCKSRMQR